MPMRLPRMRLLGLAALAALVRGGCIRASYEYLRIDVNRDAPLEPQIEARCNGSSCGFRQVLVDDWSILRVSHRHPRMVQTNAMAPIWPVLMAPELPSSLAAADLCERRNLSGFECRSLKQIARENRPTEWCAHDASKAESLPSQARLLKSVDFDEHANDVERTPSLCIDDGPSDSAYCGGVLYLDSPRDGAVLAPTLQRGTFSPSLRIQDADGTSRDFVDVLRNDLSLNATIATSVDLYTWSIARYPRDADSLPVFGYLRMAVGTHSLYVVVLDGSGRPLAEPVRSTFTVELEGAEAEAAQAAFPSTSDGMAARNWYLQRPWQLSGRAEVLRRSGHGEEARASEQLFLALSEWTGVHALQAVRDFGEVKPATGYVSFRSPPNGLSNQRRDLATMVLIANALRRTFVLPFLFTYGEDGSKMQFLDFGEIYDEGYFIDTLSKLGVSAEPELSTRNRSTAAHKAGEIAERDCSPDPDASEDFYKERMDVSNEILHVVWPAGTYSQTTMLNLFDEPVRLPKIRSAFRWAPKIARRASELASAARRKYGPKLGCLHLRVEKDWKSHAVSLGKATRVPHDGLYWVAGDEAVKRVAAHPAFRNVDVVFLAVGNDTDAMIPLTLNGAPLVDRRHLTHEATLSDEWDPEADNLLMRAALDMAVCEHADAVAGNTWSSFFQELSAYYEERGKPAVAYNAPGKRAATVTDGGVLGSPLDATRRPMSSRENPALFHVPVDLCSSERCGRWTMSVFGAQSADESVDTFLAGVDDDVRDAVDDASKAQLMAHVERERAQRQARLEAHAAWASSKPTDALDALRRAVDGVTDVAQRSALDSAFEDVEKALTAARRRAAGVGDAATRAAADAYDAERADLPAARRDACFDHSILQQHHGGPASNLAVAQHSPDPTARATPLLRIIQHRHELPSLLQDLGLDRVGVELGVWKSVAVQKSKVRCPLDDAYLDSLVDFHTGGHIPGDFSGNFPTSFYTWWIPGNPWTFTSRQTSKTTRTLKLYKRSRRIKRERGSTGTGRRTRRARSMTSVWTLCTWTRRTTTGTAAPI